MILPRILDERPYDGFSLVVPLPAGRRFQLGVVPSADREPRTMPSLTLRVELRAFVWNEND